MSFKGKKHNAETRAKIGDGVRRYYAERESQEMSEARKEKLREINVEKEKVYKFFLENLHTINKAVQAERAKRKKREPHGNNDNINKDI